jgi:phosphate transport system protein
LDKRKKTSMTKHLQVEIENLKKKILWLGARVEGNVRMAVKSVNERDAKLASEVIRVDSEIDRAEVELEEECLKILALHQPVAIDLRFIIAVLKINNDLERIGDEAVNIAERASFLSSHERINASMNFPEMAKKTQRMLKTSLDALVQMDSKLAHDVCIMDDDVDNINRKIFDIIKDRIRHNPEYIDSFIELLSIARYLERIADHATNIAEDVIYMVEGIIPRHWPERDI